MTTPLARQMFQMCSDQLRPRDAVFNKVLHGISSARGCTARETGGVEELSVCETRRTATADVDWQGLIDRQDMQAGVGEVGGGSDKVDSWLCK